MAEENSNEKIIKGAKSFITNMPSVGNGTYAIQQSIIEGYGSGQVAYDALKSDLTDLDLTLNLQESELKKQIIKSKKDLKKLEDKISALHVLIGEDGTAGEGTTFHDLVNHLTGEVEKLRRERDTLEDDISAKEKVHENNLDLFGTKEKTALEKANEKIKEAEESAAKKINLAKENANQKVKLIEQFRDFLDETNKNMRLYHNAILALLAIVLVAVFLSIPDLLSCFESYDNFITKLGTKASTWQIINLAFGFLIVKLPWAFVISAIFTGFYRLIKGLLVTYEKINQDKRNMSAIYAVSGNIAQSLNEYGLGIVEANTIEEDGSVETILVRISNKDLNQKKESLKWNQIMNYFERMQHHKEDVIEKEDESKLKLVTDLLKSAMEKIPKT